MAVVLKRWLFSVVFLYFSFRASGSHVRELSSSDISNIGQITNKDFIAVFFEKPAIRNSHPKFTREFAKASNVLDSFGFELAKVDCAKQSIAECSSGNNEVFTYRKRDSRFLEKLEVRYLFNVDSIVANLLHISLSEKFHYVSDDESLKELLSEGKGKKDVLFCFVKGLGMTEHRKFLEFVHFSKGETLFAITTAVGTAKTYGVASNVDAALFLFQCKDLSNSEDECHLTQYKGKIDKLPLIRFLQGLTLPKYVILPSNRTTVYDSALVPVNQVFVFSDRISDLETKEVEEMVMEFQGSVGVILVDFKKHKNMLSSFGLSEESSFPTAAFVPVKSKNDNLTYMELYPENAAELTINNLKHFVKPLVEDPSSEYRRLAGESSLQMLSYVEYSDSMKTTDTNYLLSLDFLLVVFCPEDHEPCKKFSKTLRRIVRTFDSTGENRLSIAYVKTSLHKKRFEGESFPVIHLHLSRSSDFIQYMGKLEYEELMDFITVSTRMKMPVFLPPSLSDLVPIELHKDNDDGDVTEAEEEAREERESSESSEEEGDEFPSVEETEDDEVSGAVLKAKLTVFPDDVVPALTDKTFDVARKESDLLVVDFFQPWDARSKAFSQPFVDAATSLGGLEVGNFAIKLARVNCFDWTDVCQNNNITIYPTVKMFRKGSDDIIYRGPLDSDHLTRAVLLLQPTVPLALKSKAEVEMFFGGKLPKLANKATDIAVVGMFSDEKGKEFKAYESAAQSLYSTFLLGYVTGETATSLSAEYGLRLPSLLVFKRKDPYQSMNIFSDPFTAQFIVDFVHRSDIPSFGVLTPFNLPTYLTHKRPLLIVFRADSEDASITPVMTKLARDNSLPSIFLCWMPVYSNNDINAEILKTYTGSSDTLPALVLVNHDKGTFYHYNGEVTKTAVLNWVEDILGGKERLTGSFSGKEWKPLLEGYDFLKMIDEEEEEKERKRVKKLKLEEAVEQAIADEEERSEDSSLEPNDAEVKPTKHDEKPKLGRLRRPEVKDAVRDEL